MISVPCRQQFQREAKKKWLATALSLSWMPAYFALGYSEQWSGVRRTTKTY